MKLDYFIVVINCAVNIASNGAEDVTGLNVDLF